METKFKPLENYGIELREINGYKSVNVRLGDFNGARYLTADGVLMNEIKPANNNMVMVSHLYVSSYGACFPLVKTTDDTTPDNDLKRALKDAFKYIAGRIAVRKERELTESDYNEIFSNAHDVKQIALWCRNMPLELNAPYVRYSPTRTRCYRLAGANSYYYDYESDTIKSYERKPLHYRVTRKLKTCCGCNRNIYRKYSERNSGGEIMPFFENYYCFECVRDFSECGDCLTKRPPSESGETCVSCESDFKRGVHSYGYTPKHFHFYDINENGEIVSTPKMRDPKKLFFGFEWETELLSGYGDYDEDHSELNDIAYNIKYTMKQFRIYATSDSSLNSGFELHNHPTTFNAIKKMNFNPFFDADLSATEYDTTGLHIHLNRSAFSKLTLFKFANFLYEFQTFSEFLSGRNSLDAMNDYAPFRKHHMGDLKYYLCKSAKNRLGKFGDKYNALNMTHKHTIELRFFGGCGDVNSFNEKIEFIKSLHEYVKTSGITPDLTKYAGYVHLNKKRFPNFSKLLNTSAGRNAIKNQLTTKGN